ncbi:MAG: peptide-methionine (S)-S-oxide reductase [Wenzhouxiangella sp.]
MATRIEPAETFWVAEDYHQQYLARRGGSCAV